MRTYITIKDNVEVENHVKYCYYSQNRCLVAQIRCGILPLKTETCRYSNLPEEERLCDICNWGKVENEMHFMVECPMYLEERWALYNAAHLDFDNRNMTDLVTFTH